MVVVSPRPDHQTAASGATDREEGAAVVRTSLPWEGGLDLVLLAVAAEPVDTPALAGRRRGDRVVAVDDQRPAMTAAAASWTPVVVAEGGAAFHMAVSSHSRQLSHLEVWPNHVASGLPWV